MKILQEDGRLSNAELAERVSLSASPCWKRLKRLESSGVIRGYQAVLDRRALGMGVVAFVSISLENHTEKTCQAFEASVLAMPEVMACHNTTGQHDYLLHHGARLRRLFGIRAQPAEHAARREGTAEHAVHARGQVLDPAASLRGNVI